MIDVFAMFRCEMMSRKNTQNEFLIKLRNSFNFCN